MVFEADRVLKLGSAVTSFVYEAGIHMRARTFTTILIHYRASLWVRGREKEISWACQKRVDDI